MLFAITLLRVLTSFYTCVIKIIQQPFICFTNVLTPFSPPLPPPPLPTHPPLSPPFGFPCISNTKQTNKPIYTISRNLMVTSKNSATWPSHGNNKTEKERAGKHEKRRRENDKCWASNKIDPKNWIKSVEGCSTDTEIRYFVSVSICFPF